MQTHDSSIRKEDKASLYLHDEEHKALADTITNIQSLRIEMDMNYETLQLLLSDSNSARPIVRDEGSNEENEKPDSEELGKEGETSRARETDLQGYLSFIN